MRVSDPFGGNLYWAEITAPVVGPKGRVTIWEPRQFYDQEGYDKFTAFKAAHPNAWMRVSPFEAPDLPASSYADNPHAQAIGAAAADLVAKRDLWLNPPDLVDRVPEVVAGFPDRIIAKNPIAAATLKTRTLTNLYNTRGTPAGAWLDALHARLDAAVAAAYGWPADISTDDALAALLALNLHRAKQASVVG